METSNGDNENTEMDDSGVGTDDSLPTKMQVVENGYRGSVELLDLSDDVLLVLLKYCSVYDRKALWYTCTRLANLVMDHTLWYRVDARQQPSGIMRMRWIMMFLWKETTELKVSGFAKETSPCLRSLQMSPRRVWDNNFNVPDGDMEKPCSAVMGCRCAASGPISHIANRYIRGNTRSPFDVYRNIRCVCDIPSTCERHEGPKYTFDLYLLKDLINKCPNLHTLELEYCNINCIATTLSLFPRGLKRLSLLGSKCYNQSYEKSFLFKVQDYLTVLEELDLSCCKWLEPSCMLPLSKMPSLKKLYMRRCPKMTEFVAYASLATRYGFNKLEVVDMRESPVGDSEVSSFGWVKSLRELYASPASAKELLQSDYAEPTDTELEPWEEDIPHMFRNKLIHPLDEFTFRKRRKPRRMTDRPTIEESSDSSSDDDDNDDPPSKKKRSYLGVHNNNNNNIHNNTAPPPVENNAETNRFSLYSDKINVINALCKSINIIKRVNYSMTQSITRNSSPVMRNHSKIIIISPSNSNNTNQMQDGSNGVNAGASTSNKGDVIKNEVKEDESKRSHENSDNPGTLKRTCENAEIIEPTPGGSSNAEGSRKIKITINNTGNYLTGLEGIDFSTITVPKFNKNKKSKVEHVNSAPSSENNTDAPTNEEIKDANVVDMECVDEIAKEYDRISNQRNGDSKESNTHSMVNDEMADANDMAGKSGKSKNTGSMLSGINRAVEHGTDGNNASTSKSELSNEPRTFGMDFTTENNQFSPKIEAENEAGTSKNRSNDENNSISKSEENKEVRMSEHDHNAQNNQSTPKIEAQNETGSATNKSNEVNNAPGSKSEVNRGSGTPGRDVNIENNESTPRTQAENEAGNAINNSNEQNPPASRPRMSNGPVPAENNNMGPNDGIRRHVARFEVYNGAGPSRGPRAFQNWPEARVFVVPPLNENERIPMNNILHVDIARRLFNSYTVSNGPNAPPAQWVSDIDPSNFVTDSAVFRFGHSESEPASNVVQIGPNINIPASRPSRSNIRILSLNGYRNITDRSLVHLATAAPYLTHLDLTRTRVTASGVENFKSLRPECTVIWSRID